MKNLFTDIPENLNDELLETLLQAPGFRIEKIVSRGYASPFERIKRTNEAGMEFWSSRDFSEILGYCDYRNFEGVIEKAKLSCFNSGHRIEDHFVDITEMIEIGKGGQRPVKTVLLSRYACYLAREEWDAVNLLTFTLV